mgnify:CR=1 FL=1|jgi:hypothetical protein
MIISFDIQFGNNKIAGIPLGNSGSEPEISGYNEEIKKQCDLSAKGAQGRI